MDNVQNQAADSSVALRPVVASAQPSRIVMHDGEKTREVLRVPLREEFLLAD